MPTNLGAVFGLPYLANEYQYRPILLARELFV
eukprot:SAG31_NODE_17449_length_670_cov_0.905429_1_plen_31_part_01